VTPGRPRRRHPALAGDVRRRDVDHAAKTAKPVAARLEKLGELRHPPRASDVDRVSLRRGWPVPRPLRTCTENLDPAKDDDQGVLEGGKGASVNTVAEARDTDDFRRRVERLAKVCAVSHATITSYIRRP